MSAPDPKAERAELMNEAKKTKEFKSLYQQFRKQGMAPPRARNEALDEMYDMGKHGEPPEEGEGKGAGGKKDDSAGHVLKMMNFQYGPVEKHLLSHVSDEQKKMYKNLSNARKIAILDKWHAKFMEE